MLKDPFDQGKAWKNGGWWLALAIVIGCHIGAVYILMGVKNPELQVGQSALFDMTEGAAAPQREEFVQIEDLYEPPPPPPPVKEEPIAVEAPTPDEADLAAEPPKPEIKPEPEPEKKVEPPKPKEKPKEKPKPKKVPKPKVKKPVEKPMPHSPDAVPGTQNVSAQPGTSTNPNSTAQGMKGEGKDAYTAASHTGGYLHNPKPPYPAESIDNEEQGTVTLEVVVEPDGRPSEVQIVKSSGYRRLDQSAYRTVKEHYRFTPATRLGVPVRSKYQFKINFSLDDL